VPLADMHITIIVFLYKNQKSKTKSGPDVETLTAVSVFNYSRFFGSHGVTYCWWHL